MVGTASHALLLNMSARNLLRTATSHEPRTFDGSAYTVAQATSRWLVGVVLHEHEVRVLPEDTLQICSRSKHNMHKQALDTPDHVEHVN